MLNEQDIRAFVYGTTRYFEIAVQQAASVGSPYLVTKGAPEVHDYSGVISVSGRRNGIVYFSASRGMLTVLLMKMNESIVSNEYLCDMVGEVANTIAGNVRRDLGKDFAISVPTVVSGAGSAVVLPPDTRPVVIPINWRSHVAKLVVCLK
jgi:chemotaxis protein CheX